MCSSQSKLALKHNIKLRAIITFLDLNEFFKHVILWGELLLFSSAFSYTVPILTWNSFQDNVPERRIIFMTQVQGTLTHLPAPSTLRASLLSSPRRTQTQHHLHKCKKKDTKTHGLFRTVGQLLVMFIHFLPLFHLSALGVTSFWFWPTSRPRCLLSTDLFKIGSLTSFITPIN